MKFAYQAAVSGLALFSLSAFAQEYPLGHPVIKNGMEIQGVYLQPITMDTGRRSPQNGAPTCG